MIRLRALIERPVDPEAARWVVALSLAVTVGLACLIGISAGSRGKVGTDRSAPASTSAVRPSSSLPPAAAGHRRRRRQDPQDRPGTPAHRRAARELTSHRALQHVPWRGDGVSISLVGARDGKAVLAVVGPGLAADRRGRRAFLRRYRDDGRSYLFRLRVARGGRR